MLSPIITTKGNSKRPYHFAIWSPTSTCRWSPVPLSPITAKCSEFGLFGIGTCACCCGRAAALHTSRASAGTRLRAGTERARRNGITTISLRWLRRLLEGPLDEVGNDVGVRVEHDHVVAHEAVLELLGQLGQLLQHL